MLKLVFSQFNPADESVPGFREWCVGQRFPAQLSIPGVDSVALYDVVDAPGRFAICDLLSDIRVLESAAYQELRSTLNASASFVCDELSSTGSDETAYSLYIVAFNVPPTETAEFDEWYEQEHVPLLLRVPGWRGVRRYAVRSSSDGPPWTRLALHSLRDRDVLLAPERLVTQAATGRVVSLAKHPWFSGKRRGRWLYELNRRASGFDR